MGWKRKVGIYVLEYTEICANPKWKLLYKMAIVHLSNISNQTNKQTNKNLPGKVNTSVKEWLKQN